MRPAWILFGLCIGLPAWPRDAVRAEDGEPELATPAWVELEFEARKFFFEATTRLSTRLESATAVREDLRASPDATPRGPSGAHVAVVRLLSELPFGRHETATAWIDAGNGAGLQGERLTTGHKNSWKLWRYLEHGKYVWRVSPEGKQEERLDSSAWTRRRERFEGWQGSVPPRMVMTDSYALLYLVSASRLERAGAERKFCLEVDGRLVEIRFQAGEEITDRFEFEEVVAGSSRMRQGKMTARAVRGIGRAVDGGSTDDDVDLGFMGLKGTITILADERTGVPLEIRGRADGVGRVTVRLRRVVLAEPPAAGGDGRP